MEKEIWQVLAFVFLAFFIGMTIVTYQISEERDNLKEQIKESKADYYFNQWKDCVSDLGKAKIIMDEMETYVNKWC